MSFGPMVPRQSTPSPPSLERCLWLPQMTEIGEVWTLLLLAPSCRIASAYGGLLSRSECGGCSVAKIVWGMTGLGVVPASARGLQTGKALGR